MSKYLCIVTVRSASSNETLTCAKNSVHMGLLVLFFFSFIHLDSIHIDA